MIKAIAGGGGRGMRVVEDLAKLDEAYARCQSEAKAAFGNGRTFEETMREQMREAFLDACRWEELFWDAAHRREAWTR